MYIYIYIYNIWAVRNWLANNIPDWKDMNITNHGKYLGFFIGPDAGKHNWSSPISKYKQRSREIHVAALPAAFSASEYNTKCLPTLLYVSQLCSPRPTSSRLSLVLFTKYCTFRRRPLVTISPLISAQLSVSTCDLLVLL